MSREWLVWVLLAVACNGSSVVALKAQLPLIALLAMGGALYCWLSALKEAWHDHIRWRP